MPNLHFLRFLCSDLCLLCSVSVPLGTPLRARSKITRQFPLILNQAGDLTNFSIPNSQFSSEGAVGLGTIRFFRMRIENWELRIGQILPILHSAKLFLREPLRQRPIGLALTRTFWARSV